MRRRRPPLKIHALRPRTLPCATPYLVPCALISGSAANTCSAWRGGVATQVVNLPFQNLDLHRMWAQQPLFLTM